MSLRNDLIKLAAEVPETRRHIVPLLRSSGELFDVVTDYFMLTDPAVSRGRWRRVFDQMTDVMKALVRRHPGIRGDIVSNKAKDGPALGLWNPETSTTLFVEQKDWNGKVFLFRDDSGRTQTFRATSVGQIIKAVEKLGVGFFFSPGG